MTRPPFTPDVGLQKARKAEDLGNSRDPVRKSHACLIGRQSPDSAAVRFGRKREAHSNLSDPGV